jgi:hypothetical protein
MDEKPKKLMEVSEFTILVMHKAIKELSDDINIMEQYGSNVKDHDKPYAGTELSYRQVVQSMKDRLLALQCDHDLMIAKKTNEK